MNDVYVREIEYTLLDSDGDATRDVSKLTDHSGATVSTYDYDPAVAVAPNGNIGVLWYRYLYNSSNGTGNYNIFFAILDSAGNPVSGPLNMTNNNVWGDGNVYGVPQFSEPRIAATDDNRFVLAWRRYSRESTGSLYDIYYAVRDANGGAVKGVTRFTDGVAGDDYYYDPALASLSGNRALLAYYANSSISYAVLDSAGNVFKGETATGGYGYKPDAVQLANGSVLLAWTSWGADLNEISFAVLDGANYNVVAGPTALSNPAAVTGNNYVSVTADRAGRGILTWMDSNSSYRRNLYYALVGGNGTILTDPMIFRTSQATDPYIETSFEGYGNTSWTDESVLLELGEPGTSFRYTETMGETETAYPANTSYLNGPNGLFIDTSDNLYVAEELGARMLKYRTSDGVNLLSIGAAGFQNRDEYTFNYPRAVTVDGYGNIWTADQHRVAQYDAGGAFLQEFPSDDPWNAGEDEVHFDTPRGIAFDSSGRMYVSDSNNHRIQVYTFDVDGVPVYSTTIGVTGQSGSSNVYFNRPAQIVINSNDQLYVADVNNYRVQRCYYDDDSWTCGTIHGTGSAGDGTDELNLAFGLGVNADGDIYVADGANGRVKECYADMFGWTCDVFASGLNLPAGIAVDSNGHVYVSDWSDHTIRKYDSDGNALGVLVGTSGVPYLTDDGHFNKPIDVAVDGDGNRFVIEEAGHRLLKLGLNGNAMAVVGTPGVTGDDNAHFNWAQGVAVSVDGTVYLADTGNHRVQIFDNDLNYQTTLGTGTCESTSDAFCGPHNVALDTSGRLYVVDTWNHRVQVFDSRYNLVATLGISDQTGHDSLHFRNPRGVAVDAEGSIYVADEANKRVQKCVLVGEGGNCTTFAGVTGVDSDYFSHFRAPLDVEVDAQGRVYVSDTWWNQRVQIFDSSGAYLTTIGGVWGGQHGRFRNPSGIGIAPDGAVYIADIDNMRIEQYALGVPDWTQININGFGDPKTKGVTALAEFDGYLYAGASNWDSHHGQIWRFANDIMWENVTPDSLASNAVIELTTFDDHLYAGTGWDGSAGQIWRSDDGVTWSVVVPSGFGNDNNEAVTKLTVFKGSLYAAVQNNVEGFDIWRSPTGDFGSWEAVLTGGNGNTNLYNVSGLTVFNGQIHAACENNNEGLEIWRSDNGTTWDQVASGGFEDPNNTQPGGFAIFDNYLYIGTRNNTTGAQLWRSNDGTIWSPVITNGFGDNDNQKIESLNVAYDALYAVLYNDATGAQVWRSDDGSTWSAVQTDGWGDCNNDATLWGNATLMFNDHLLIGTWNDAHGGELWRSNFGLYYEVYLPLTVKNWPPIPQSPVLNSITPPGDNPTYRVSWNPVDRADTYILERATHSDFSDMEELYNGPNTSHTVDSEGIARYYYRVKARNSWGDSGWSNVQSVEVRWEKEPNDNAPEEADGPLLPDVTYYGRFPQGDDAKDYFYFHLTTDRAVEIWLTNIPAPLTVHDYDLALYNADITRRIGLSDQSGTDYEHITTKTLSPGYYYIQVINYKGTGSTQPYHLHVVYE